MERNDFIKLCQKVSTLPIEILNDRIGQEQYKVYYDGIPYIPYGYEMMFKNGMVKNIAILKDMKANSVIRAELEKVEQAQDNPDTIN